MRVVATAFVSSALLGGTNATGAPRAPLVRAPAAVTAGAPAAADTTPLARAAAGAVPGTLARLGAPQVSTIVGALTLTGPGPLDRVEVPDLDLLDRGARGIGLPLLRLLRLLGVTAGDADSALAFTVGGTTRVRLDWAQDSVTVGGVTRGAECVAGISDITGQPEVWVADSVLAAMLAMDVSWDTRTYELRMVSPRPLPASRRSRAGANASPLTLASYDLPDRLPAARSRRVLVPQLDFARFRLASSWTRLDRTTGFTRTGTQPAADVWARALGGAMTARVVQDDANGGNRPRLEHAAWTARGDATAVALGDVNAGLSGFVFPSLALVGAMANGRVGAAARAEERDPSQSGRNATFLPVRVFEGRAPAGSDVTLRINGQDVETRKAETAPEAGAGEGAYRFEGVNLLVNRTNDVEIRVVAPDGRVDELHRRVLGTDRLMRPGEFAFAGVAGGRRAPDLARDAPAGRFIGGRGDVGLSDRVTCGIAAAWQDAFAPRDVSMALAGEAPARAPERSAHAGARIAWQLRDPLLVTLEAARSVRLPDTSATALRADAEWQHGELSVHPVVFRLAPGFFDGQNAATSDLGGAAIGTRWRYGHGAEFTLGAVRMRDGLDGRRARPLRTTGLEARWTVPGIVPRATLTLGARRTAVDGGPLLATWLAGIEGRLPGAWNLTGNSEFGDDLRRRLADRLPGGSPWRFDWASRACAVAGSNSGAGTGMLSSRLELRRRFGDAWQLSLAHRDAGTFRRSTLDLLRNAPERGMWQARLSPGVDWDTRSLLVQARLELLAGAGRDNRIAFEGQYLSRRWSLRVSLQMLANVGFASGRMVPLLDRRIDPEAGGIKGRVFLDGNGNGLPDPGEPGVPGIEVANDNGRRTTSAADGFYVLPNASSQRRTRVSLQPDALPAAYTPTQGTQEALLRPGEFTEVNLGVAALGSITGSVIATPAPGDTGAAARAGGVAGVRVLLVNAAGETVGRSVTGRAGDFTLTDVVPGRYSIRIDGATLPEGFEPVARDFSIEMKSAAEPSGPGPVTFTGRYAATAPAPVQAPDGRRVDYKVFPAAPRPATPAKPAPR